MKTRFAIFAFAALSLAHVAAATTYVVDDTPGPGVDFNDIPAAVAFAQPGDILLVAPGTYSGFVLDRGLVIIGALAADCTAPIEVRNLPADQRAAITQLTTSDLLIDACAGAVVADALGTLSTVRIQNSNDVRLHRTTVGMAIDDHLDAIEVHASRLELVECTVTGHDGTASTGPGVDGVGAGAGISLTGASRLCAARCTIRGGNGAGETEANIYAGDGGVAIRMGAGTRVIALGPDSSLIGGFGGGNLFYSNDCTFDGANANAVLGVGPNALLFDSATALITYLYTVDLHCIPLTPAPALGVTRTIITPADPVLTVNGPLTPGSTVTFVLTGEVGASATLNLGRGFVLQPTPGVLIERLVPPARIFQLGTIPASGSVSRSIVLSPTFPDGFVFGAQAEVVGTNGLRRTNSAPVIVR
jgi:hypothetical protein